MSNLTYYRKNVKYVVGGRRFIGDPQGFTLTEENPFIAVKPEDLRDFKIANKRALEEGLFREVDEPSVDWQTSNVITDEEVENLLKNYMQLKKVLQQITSLPMVAKIMDAAKAAEKSPKTIKLIEARMAELTEPEEFGQRSE